MTTNHYNNTIRKHCTASHKNEINKKINKAEKFMYACMCLVIAAELNNVHATGCLAAIIKYLDVSTDLLLVLYILLVCIFFVCYIMFINDVGWVCPLETIFRRSNL